MTCVFSVIPMNIYLHLNEESGGKGIRFGFWKRWFPFVVSLLSQ